MKSHKKKTYDQGLFAEGVAEIFLRAKGFGIVARRYKTPVGEIDLIALDGDDLVFIEVKARRTIDEALYAITPRMKARITEAAGHFIAAYPAHARRSMRFDVMAVKLPFAIHHLENAWMG